MHLNGECSSGMDSGDCSRNPSWCTGLTGTTEQSVAGSAYVVCCTNVLNCCLFLLLNLGGFTGLFSWAMCAGDGIKASILVRSWRLFRSWLGEKPVLSGVRRYCIRNSCSARRGGSLDFFSDCLKDCTILSAAPLVAGS